MEPPRQPYSASVDPDVASVLAWLEAHGSSGIREAMGPRYGVHTDQAFGVAMADMLALAKKRGSNHALAAELWRTGWYEARMVASMIDDPACVTGDQMDQWCRDFDNWGICDTVCFKLFDHVPFALDKVAEWALWNGEFQRRGAFALLACVALHRADVADESFAEGLALIERFAGDDRNFVKKAVNWALRAIGLRSSAALRITARDVAARLAASTEPARRWVGRDAVRAFDKADAKKPPRSI